MDMLCDGKISGVEFASFLSKLFSNEELDHAHMSTIFRVFDKHRNGSLSFEDFVLSFDILLHGTLLKSIGD